MLDHEYEIMRRMEDVHWWYRTLSNLVVRGVTRRLGADAPAKLLDAGCGTGGTMSRLRSLSSVWELSGVDLSPLAVQFAHDRGLDNVSAASIDALPFADATFDGVISLDVLYHKEVDEDKAVSELSRVLGPGGILVLNLPAFPALAGRHQTAVHGVRRYTAGRIRKLLEPHGYAIETVHYWNAWLFLPVLIYRQLSLLFHPMDLDETRSDLGYLPGILNKIMIPITGLDARVCSALHVPFGTSIFAVARKLVPKSE